SSPRVLTAESLEDIWQQVLSQVGFLLASGLRKAVDLAIFGPNTLVLRFPQGYNSGDQYLDSNRLAKVEEVLTRIVGQPCTLRTEIAEQRSKENGTVAEGAAPSAGVAKRQRQQTEVARIPLVGKAMDVLGGQIVQMDEDFGNQMAAADGPEFPDTTEE